MSWFSNSPKTKKELALSLLKVAGVGVMGWSTYHMLKQKPKQNIAPSAEEEHDQKLKADLQGKVGPHITTNIALQAAKNRELETFQDRCKLLPAIIPGCTRSKINRIIWALNGVQSSIPLPINDAIALILFKNNDWNGPHNIINKRFIKNNNVRDLVGEIAPGECAFIKFSDNSIQIHLNNSDRRALIKLRENENQYELVKSLYQRPNERRITLTHAETKIYNSLKSEIKVCISQNYNLRFTQSIFPSISPFQLRIGLGCAIHALSWLRAFQSKTNFEFESRILHNKISAVVLVLQCLLGYGLAFGCDELHEFEDLKKNFSNSFLATTLLQATHNEYEMQKWNKLNLADIKKGNWYFYGPNNTRARLLN